MKKKKKIVIKPVSGFLVVRPKKAKKITKGGILLPQTGKDRPSQGRVIAIDDKEVNPSCRVGDDIVFKQWNGHEYKEFLFLETKDVLAIVKKKK